MNACRRDLTLGEAMSDPLIRAVMRADGINPAELEASLAALGDKLEKRNRAGGGSLPARCVFDC
jgi:hypothetical protein